MDRELLQPSQTALHPRILDTHRIRARIQENNRLGSLNRRQRNREHSNLAGGQVVGKILQRTYGIDGPGRLFYDFTALGNPSTFRARYRALLDEAPWTPAQRERLLAEAVHAFELNIAVLTEMAQEVGLGQPLAS
ncbi:biliverdin-producing heme oxygenase [Pseudonocardia sp. Ae717_Ps2]|uniref:biliverdin-producing heme oxygenase n=1 Tax=Pseudonocardia sp. Ae717_Ps2 TaxID=1885573 RepID=UPI001E4BDEBF|nr:biliverdin-producing heme oxygenase [Pseudonocardia sp. Ae717_Ps2]